MDISKNQRHQNKPQCIIDLTNDVAKIETYRTIILGDDGNDDDVENKNFNKIEYSDISSDDLQDSKCSSLVESTQNDHHLSRYDCDDGGWTNHPKKSEYSYASSVDLQTSKYSAFVESSEEGELPEESPRIGELGDEHHPEDLMIIPKCNKRKRKHSTHKLERKIRKLKKKVTNVLSDEAEEIAKETTTSTTITTTLRKRNVRTMYTTHTTSKCERKVIREQLVSPDSDTKKYGRSNISSDSEKFCETLKFTISNSKMLNNQCVNELPSRYYKSIDRPLPECRRNCRRNSSREKIPQPLYYRNISKGSELTFGVGEICGKEKLSENSRYSYATSDLESLIARTKQREKKHNSAGSYHVDHGVHTE